MQAFAYILDSKPPLKSQCNCVDKYESRRCLAKVYWVTIMIKVSLAIAQNYKALLYQHNKSPHDKYNEEQRIKHSVDLIAVLKIGGADIESISDFLPTKKL